MAKIVVAIVAVIVVALVTARIYIGRIGSAPDVAVTYEHDPEIETLQKNLGLPKALIGTEIATLSPEMNHLFSKALGGDHRDIEVSLLKWRSKFFVVSVRGGKILDALEAPFWGEDQGWFVGCVDKPGGSLENSVAFAGWQDNARQILKAWRVEAGDGGFISMSEKEFQNIDCTKIPGWIEDFEFDADEG